MRRLFPFVLGSRTEAEVADLYDAAKKKGVFLDPYAGANVWEYWAQGVEAYLMLVPKTGCPGELLAEDPDLYAYLEKRFGPSP